VSVVPVHHGYGTPSHQDPPMTLLLNPHEYDHDHDAGGHGHGHDDDDGGRGRGHGCDGHGHGHGYDDHVKPLTIVCKGF
jgi:hypothetical protein